MEQDLSQRLGLIKARFVLSIFVLADAAALLSSVIIAFLLRFDSLPLAEINQRYLQPHIISSLLAMAIYSYAFSLLRLYRCAWRFAGLEILWSVIMGNTIGVTGLFALQRFLDGSSFPISVIIILWAIGILLTGGLRVALRMLSAAKRHNRNTRYCARYQHPRRVVILGGGANGARILKSIREDPELQYDIIGFLDDDPAKNGVYIRNVKVLGPIDSLERLLSERAVDEVIIAIPNMDEKRLREYVMECRHRKLPVKLVPQLSDVLNGKHHLQLVDFDVEDLLRRSPANTNISAMGKYLTGKRVMITGAGGSIGSELCRQIISMDPSAIFLLGHGENSIHQIFMELQHSYPYMSERIHCAIASVAHQQRVEQVIEAYKPNIVFHAAAHKHVPMMETNEQEAVRNNVLGTYHIAEACGKFGVERIVLISTDKAADPCCIMGITKRLCEEIFRSAASFWPKTCYVTVRFGNVLGSRGSVVSIFRQQIKHGGPVTITHPEMTRYFMTIPESVRLVLQAGGVGGSGELYLLEMGKPMRVLDLAKDMIRLSGYEPDVDIKIEYSGIRPGEKLHERLASEEEQIEPTPWEGLSLVRKPMQIGANEMLNAIVRLDHITNYGNGFDTRKLLRELVPGCASGTETQAASECKLEVVAAKVRGE
ncbi:MAG: nucleoside-diphosphate sugar epimerase/dehydratase [Armatimonadetes bacterium]|nr:nucleoside-diphosphate sugar epimerase/dehydratase [Armatimonadota bacterium]